MDRMEATVTEKTDETALSSYVVLPDFDVTRMRLVSYGFYKKADLTGVPRGDARRDALLELGGWWAPRATADNPEPAAFCIVATWCRMPHVFVRLSRGTHRRVKVTTLLSGEYDPVVPDEGAIREAAICSPKSGTAIAAAQAEIVALGAAFDAMNARICDGVTRKDFDALVAIVESLGDRLTEVEDTPV